MKSNWDWSSPVRMPFRVLAALVGALLLGLGILGLIEATDTSPVLWALFAVVGVAALVVAIRGRLVGHTRLPPT